MRHLPAEVPEVSEQCSSCPFRFGNDAEWKSVLGKLRLSAGDPREVTDADALRARAEVFNDIENRGDFICHHSVYEAGNGMKKRDMKEWRQCKGATEAFRKSKPVMPGRSLPSRSKRVPKKHSRSGQVRCAVCAPARCAKAKTK